MIYSRQQEKIKGLYIIMYILNSSLLSIKVAIEYPKEHGKIMDKHYGSN